MAVKGLMAAEWVVMGYTLLTLVWMAAWWSQLTDATGMLVLRAVWLAGTLLLWWLHVSSSKIQDSTAGGSQFFTFHSSLFTLHSSLFTLHSSLFTFLRIIFQLAMLSFWYPDLYELNRMLPNLDHLFANAEQQLFGCQPALLMADWAPWPWFSELMCVAYLSYFPLIALVTLYYFLRCREELQRAFFVIIASFFAYYIIFILLPVTGPQFYYPAVGVDQIAAGHFPDLGQWFMTHGERMAAPGWDGPFHHLLDNMHDAGERPVAAFPSSHVGITTVLLLLALHTRCRWLTALVATGLLLMCFATLYILAHYLVDVVAGLVTGVLFYYVFKRLNIDH